LSVHLLLLVILLSVHLLLLVILLSLHLLLLVMTNNDLQNITQKTKDRATQTLLKTGSERMRSGRAISSCSIWNIRRNVVLGGYLQYTDKTLYHILVAEKANILPYNKTLSFVQNNKRSHVYFTQFHKNGPSGLIKQVY
jgi:hypothetical protein